MPAAAVTREPRALSEFTGRKAYVGGLISLLLKFFGLTKKMQKKRLDLRTQEVNGTHGVGVKSVDIMGNTKSEGN